MLSPAPIYLRRLPGKVGTLRSTYQFLLEKHRGRAVRLHTGSLALEDVKLPGEERTVKLLSLPLYAVGQFDRLLEAAFPDPMTPIVHT